MKYWKECTIIGLIIILVIMIFTLRYKGQEAERWENNYYTSIDSINEIVTKNNELIYERDNYKLNYDELNKEQQKRIKELEKELNKKINYISKLEGNIKIDTLIIKDSTYVRDGVTNIIFDYRDDWFEINSITKLDRDTITTINNLYVNVPLTLGMTQEGNKSSVFVTTPNPYVTFSSIEGAELNNTPKSIKRWMWTAEIGMDIQYGLISRSMDVIPRIQTDIKYIFKNNVNIGARIGLNSQTSLNKVDISPYGGLYIGYGIRF